MTHRLGESLAGFAADMQNESGRILQYWKRAIRNPATGRFYGSIDADGVPDPEAPSGIVMYARILWTFSTAYERTGDATDLEMAIDAYRGIQDLFLDKEHGGVYWSIDTDLKPLETRKQIYGQAFAIYGLAAFSVATTDRPEGVEALSMARELYRLIEMHSRDVALRGYREAFSGDWSSLNDLRLSKKDANDPKTMNTHLHIVEAYAGLYAVWPDDGLRGRIIELLQLFDEHFIDHASGHLRLFFTDDWQSRSTLISYGHDIEAAWLLLHCAEVIHDPVLVARFRALAPLIATAAVQGVDADGGMWYESDPSTGEFIREKHWWPQAEAMLGFVVCFQLTGGEEWLDRAQSAWDFTQQRLVDREVGEWHWGVDENGNSMQKERAGFWKCPYHHGRACMEIHRRLSRGIRP